MRWLYDVETFCPGFFRRGNFLTRNQRILLAIFILCFFSLPQQNWINNSSRNGCKVRHCLLNFFFLCTVEQLIETLNGNNYSNLHKRILVKERHQFFFVILYYIFEAPSFITFCCLKISTAGLPPRCFSLSDKKKMAQPCTRISCWSCFDEENKNECFIISLSAISEIFNCYIKQQLLVVL